MLKERSLYIIIIILGISSLIAASVAIFVTMSMPPSYMAKTKILINPVNNSAASGLTVGNRPLNIDSYVAIVEDDRFGDLVLNRIINDTDNITNKFSNERNLEFSISAVNIPNTSILEISVVASSPNLARDYTNAAAAILSEESKKLKSISSKEFSDDIYKNKINYLDNELKRLRMRKEELKVLVDITPNNRTAELASINDEIEDTKCARSMYLNCIESVKLSEILSANYLKVIYPATLPKEVTGPGLIKNILMALLVNSLVITLVYLIVSVFSSNKNCEDAKQVEEDVLKADERFKK